MMIRDMELRDFFAGLAMLGWMSGHWGEADRWEAGRFYDWAETMIREKEQRDAEDPKSD